MKVRVFVWKTRVGERVPVRDMATDHICHSLIMIWNHTVEKPYQFLPFRRYRLKFSLPYKRAAIRAFIGELDCRDDISPGHASTIRRMRDICKKENDEYLLPTRATQMEVVPAEPRGHHHRDADLPTLQPPAGRQGEKG